MGAVVHKNKKNPNKQDKCDPHNIMYHGKKSIVGVLANNQWWSGVIRPDVKHLLLARWLFSYNSTSQSFLFLLEQSLYCNAFFID